MRAILAAGTISMLVLTIVVLRNAGVDGRVHAQEPAYFAGMNKVEWTTPGGPVTTALADIAGSYEIVFHLGEDGGWSHFAPALPDALNTLGRISAGNTYWIRLNASVPPTPSAFVAFDPVTVVDVIDGNTIAVRFPDGREESVRYLGVDAPELSDPWGVAAAERNADLVRDQVVWLERDVSDRGSFGRLVRHAHILHDGAPAIVAAILLSEGLAFERTSEPDVAREALFRSLETLARDLDAGIWSPAGTTPDVPAPPPAQSACHPSYPSVCIPPPPPDLNCSDIAARRFTVIGSDPHNFDSDRDGVGCES